MQRTDEADLVPDSSVHLTPYPWCSADFLGDHFSAPSAREPEAFCTKLNKKVILIKFLFQTKLLGEWKIWRCSPVGGAREHIILGSVEMVEGGQDQVKVSDVLATHKFFQLFIY